MTANSVSGKDGCELGLVGQLQFGIFLFISQIKDHFLAKIVACL